LVGDTLASLSPGADIIEEVVVAVADSIPQGDENSLWRVFRRSLAICIPLVPIIYFVVWKLGYL
tara:strand:- start:572 stop:763 length:192 start_codon:yes stop_codon:yes gene_type:complete